jgi:hypothetical protein
VIPLKERKYSSPNALFVTPLELTELDQSSEEFTVENQELLKDSVTRKSNHIKNLILIFYSGALAGKGKWTEKTIDKYIKSPADYAPGK